MAAGDIVRWISNSSGTWSTGANWDTGSAPAGQEVAYFDGTGQASVTGSDESATAALRAIITDKKYGGNIGSSGNPLIHNIETVNATKARIIHRGTGDLYFKADGAINGQVYAAFIDTKGTVNLDGNDANAAYISHLFVRGGTVTVASTCSITASVFVVGINADVTIQAVAASQVEPPIIVVTGGLLTNNRAISGSTAVASIYGGKLLQKGIVSDGNWIFVSPGGTFDYQPNAALTSSHNPHIFIGGTLDLSSSVRQVSFGNRIIGTVGGEVGAASQQVSDSPIDIDIDLREEYP